LSRLIDELIVKHEADGTLHRGDGPYVPPPIPDGVLRFPGKAIELPNGNLLVSDSARHQIVELAADGETPLRRFGTERRNEPFSEPQGLVLLPAKTAELAGYDVVVADTVNHQLRAINTGTGEITLVAGSGKPWRSTVDGHAHDALAADLSSPWDLAWYDDKVIIAMAGIHQLWWFDPIKRTVGVYAGTTVEALRDGPLPDVWMAQPSGLSVSADGKRLWIADSETSALRYVEDGVLHTVVGQGLFDFGHVDGPAAQALFQHPLGVAALPDGSVLVADTYNGAVRRFDPVAEAVSTVDSGLAEPSDVLITAGGQVVVVESAAHRLTRLAPGVVKTVTGERHKTERPPSHLAPGEVTLDVIFTPAPGQKLDSQFGSPLRLVVSASPAELLLEGEGTGTELSRRIVLNPDVPEGVLQVVAQAATCDVDAEFGACHLTRQDWGVPIVLDPAGPARLPLILRGMDA
jgi:sugar lactone lactonase YvrE